MPGNTGSAVATTADVTTTTAVTARLVTNRVACERKEWNTV